MVESAGLDQGALFTVAFPVPPLLVRPPAETPAAASRPTLQGLHLLVVEDEESGREMLAELLEQLGAEVTATAELLENLLSQLHFPGIPDDVLSAIFLRPENILTELAGCNISEHPESSNSLIFLPGLPGFLSERLCLLRLQGTKREQCAPADVLVLIVHQTQEQRLCFNLAG